MTMAHPFVYGPAGSTYVWSARLALAEKGVTHELVDVPFGTPRQEPHPARPPVPCGNRPSDGGPPLPHRRSCQPRRFDGDPTALLFRQCPGRPHTDGGAPETAELGEADGNPTELSGDQTPSVLSGVLYAA